MMINLFAYPSSFGKIKIYKCDYFGNALSLPRPCLIDNFIVDVKQKTVDDINLFGSFNQQNHFFIGNREIKITCNSFFSNSPSGILHPSIDLLFNLAAWTFQGTNTSYKIDISSISATSLVYNDPFVIEALGITNSNLNLFKFYLVSETENVQLSVSSIVTSSTILNYSSITVPSNCWLEIFQYGNINSLAEFSTTREPMFRIDSSEGSFYPCLIDKINIHMNEEYVKLSCDIMALNYDRSTRFDFINTSNIINIFAAIKPLHKSRIRIKNFENDITANFNLLDIDNIDYMNGLITQSAESTPIKDFSINIDNGLVASYRNRNHNIGRTYALGYYSKYKKINGSLVALALRSSQPTFDRYPVLSGVKGKSISILFGNQIFEIPYTVWAPGKLEVKQPNFVESSFEWEAITRARQGQPLFELYGGLI
jgi:hypothetical protein